MYGFCLPLAAQTAIQQMFEPWNAFLFFFDISSGSVCFWHTLQHARPCVLFAIQLWSVLNCRRSKLHKEGSYLCNITQSADSTDFKEHLKRRQERDGWNCLQSSYLFKSVCHVEGNVWLQPQKFGLIADMHTYAYMRWLRPRAIFNPWRWRT